MEKLYRFRVAFDESEEEYGWVFSSQSSLEFEVPPFPKVLKEKLALLRLLDVKGKADGVGQRKLKNVFYVFFTEDEYRQLVKQVESENAKETNEQPEAFKGIEERA
jgi:hypothetical protein